MPETTAILIEQSRALGRIEARLEHGDQLHRTITGRLDKQDQVLADIHDRVTVVERRPSKGRMEQAAALLKEAWPFALLAAAAAAKVGMIEPGIVSKLGGH